MAAQYQEGRSREKAGEKAEKERGMDSYEHWENFRLFAGKSPFLELKFENRSLKSDLD